MLTRDCRSENLAQRSSGGRCQRLMTIVTTVGAWLALAAQNGAEQVDSGWVVATPSTIAAGSRPADPQQQIILDHVLEQSRVPLLKRPPTLHAPQASVTHEEIGLRLTVRPDGIDGWRPAGQHLGPLANPQHLGSGPFPLTELAGPRDEPLVSPPDAARGTTSETAAEPQDDKDATLGVAVQFHPARLGASLAAPPAAEAEETQSAATNPEIEPPAENQPAATTESPIIGNSSTIADADAPTSSPTPGASVADQSTSDDSTVEPSADPLASALPRDEASDNSSGGSAADSAAADSPKVDPPAAKLLPPLTRQLTNLRSRVRGVLKGYYRKTLNSQENDPWEVMHGMLAYGVRSRIRQGGPRGEMITAVGWLCYNKPCKSLTLMYVTPEGQLRAKYGVGLQGHLGQLLAMLAQCRVASDYPIHVGKQEFTIRDLIEAEKKTCYPNSELTFKLLALQYYIDLNDKWVNDQGVEWGFPRLIREELAQPIRGAACGGTHRLSGLSLTVKTRLRRGEPLDGEYARAAEFVEKYHQYAFRLQNRDGSLSTAWFQGRGDDDDINRRIKTTGHILEWLCYSLSDEELRDQRTIRAVSYLANLMYSNYDNEWEVGPMCHATHALLLYDERVFQPYDQEGEVASSKAGRSAATRTQTNSSRR